MMKTIIQTLCCCVISMVWIGTAHADLDLYIHDLDISARADLGNYRAKLGVRFGVSNSELEILFETVETPAEVAVLLWLGEQSQQSVNNVLKIYQHHKSNGWGTMAKSLGIKPGSPTFHALKRGDLNLSLYQFEKHKNTNAKCNKKNKKSTRQIHSMSGLSA